MPDQRGTVRGKNSLRSGDARRRNLRKAKALVARVVHFQPGDPDHVDQRLARAAEVTAQLRGIRRLAHSKGHRASDLRAWLEEVMDAAIEFTEADFGCIQLVDRSKHVLRMVAHRGFQPEIVRQFQEVRDGQAACGTAMQRLRRVIVGNVEQDAIFRDRAIRELMLKANVRAVQSTPLFEKSGKLVAVVSTQYKRPRRPPARGLRYLDLLAWQIQSQLDDSLRIDADLAPLERG